MAEAINFEDIDEVMQGTQVKRGLIELSDQEKSILESFNWEPLVSIIGRGMVEKYKDSIQGGGVIIFFPSDREEFNTMMAVQNTTFMGQSLVKPLFVIKFDLHRQVEYVRRFESKIPKDLVFMVLCTK